MTTKVISEYKYYRVLKEHWKNILILHIEFGDTIVQVPAIYNKGLDLAYFQYMGEYYRTPVLLKFNKTYGYYLCGSSRLYVKEPLTTYKLSHFINDLIKVFYK